MVEFITWYGYRRPKKHFAKHYVNEEIHLKKIKAYKQVYWNFAYQILMQSSQYIINNLKLEDQRVGLVEEALELE